MGLAFREFKRIYFFLYQGNPEASGSIIAPLWFKILTMKKKELKTRKAMCIEYPI